MTVWSMSCLGVGGPGSSPGTTDFETVRNPEICLEMFFLENINYS